MWKLVFISAIIFYVVLARPQQNQGISGTITQSQTTPIPIVTQIATSNPDGSFNSSFETGNGIKVQNVGYVKKVHIPQYEENGKIIDEHEEEIIVQEGSYSYQDPDGNIITLKYIADENGFQPAGDHLPKSPEPLSQQATQQRPIIQNSPQERPIQQFPGQQINQERPIQQFPGQQLNQERPIQQFPGQQLNQERPIQQFPRQQLNQERPIQQFTGQSFAQQRPQQNQQFGQRFARNDAIELNEQLVEDQARNDAADNNFEAFQ